MATRVASAAGDISVGTNFVGGVAPVNGDTMDCHGHAMTMAAVVFVGEGASV